MNEEMYIAVVGCGHMGSALARGLVRSDAFPSRQIILNDHTPGRAEELAKETAKETKATVQSNYQALWNKADVVVLAVKPNDVPTVLDEFASIKVQGAKKVLISVAAGVTAQFIQSKLKGSAEVVRVMPNLPCLIGEGVSAVFSEDEAAAGIAESIFLPLGSVVRVSSEQAIDAVTGLSGSGPGYVFRMLEALIEGGVQAGLERETALELACQTVRGAGMLASESKSSPEELRKQVSSPGGTTVAGLAALEEGGFFEAVVLAVNNATKRAAELAKQ